jgi:hypothetical protein
VAAHVTAPTLRDYVSFKILRHRRDTNVLTVKAIPESGPSSGNLSNKIPDAHEKPSCCMRVRGCVTLSGHGFTHMNRNKSYQCAAYKFVARSEIRVSNYREKSSETHRM